MFRIPRMVASGLAIAVIVGAPFGSALLAQQPPTVKRNVLMKKDMAIEGREGVMALVELRAGGVEGRHTHPAEVFVYVLEGEVHFDLEGTTTILKAGDTFYVPPGKIHEGRNKGLVTARVLAVFVAEKGKPLTTQVP